MPERRCSHRVGDVIYVDFDTLALRVIDVSTVSKGYIETQAISGGFIGKNKAVVVDPLFDKKFHLPPLSRWIFFLNHRFQ